MPQVHYARQIGQAAAPSGAAAFYTRGTAKDRFTEIGAAAGNGRAQPFALLGLTPPYNSCALAPTVSHLLHRAGGVSGERTAWFRNSDVLLRHPRHVRNGAVLS